MPLLTISAVLPVGGATPFHLVSLATTNQTVVKTGAARLTGWAITNTNAAVRYVAFYDTVRQPVAGQFPAFKYGIPASGASNQDFNVGIQFFQGLAIATMTGSADSDATAVAAGDLVINLFYV